MRDKANQLIRIALGAGERDKSRLCLLYGLALYLTCSWFYVYSVPHGQALIYILKLIAGVLSVVTLIFIAGAGWSSRLPGGLVTLLILFSSTSAAAMALAGAVPQDAVRSIAQSSFMLGLWYLGLPPSRYGFSEERRRLLFFWLPTPNKRFDHDNS